VRRGPLLSAIVTLIAPALVIGACSGDDDGDDNPAPPPAADTAPGDEGSTPLSAGELPPAFMRCMAKQGFPIESPDEIHSAPQQVLQACFWTLPGGAVRRGRGRLLSPGA